MQNEITWLGISKDELTEGVRTRLGPSANDATVKVCTSDLSTLSEALRTDFLAYWHDKPFNKGLSAGSRSIEGLIESHEMSVIGAFLGLDWIIKEPAEAETAFKRGYDVLEFGPMSEEIRKRAEERRAELIRLNLT